MNAYVTAGAASFAYVALRAFQQLNVMSGRYSLIIPTSVAMGVGDVLLVLLVVQTSSLWMGVSNGLCAGTGAICAVWLNKRLAKKVVTQ